MSRCAVFSVLACSADALHRDSAHGFLAADLRPDVAAHLLMGVEDEWKSQATIFAECNSTQIDCGNAPVSFMKSCGTVVGAVVKASSGKKDSVVEYMNVVCQQVELQGWRQERCGELAASVTNAMGADDYQNRENFQTDTDKLCTKYWSKFASQEKERVEKERSEREALEATQAAVRAEEEKKAAAEAETQLKEQERKEAQDKAEQAKQKADEAAADFAKKKDEAERQAQDASVKMEAAQEAATQARKRRDEKMMEAHNATATNGTASAVKPNATVTNNATVVHNSTAVAANTTTAK